MHDLEQSVIRILNTQGVTVGTGFVVADRLAVTCAHVVQVASSTPDSPISIQFYQDTSKPIAHVLQEGYSPATSDDVAFLQLDRPPEGIVPVIFGSAYHSEGHRYTSFGFARLAGYDSRRPDGSIHGVVSVADRHKQRMLELEGRNIDKGLSGAPILDLKTDRVVGMVSEYKDNEQTRFAWATTTETLIDLNPLLRLWPDTYGRGELDSYLQYLIKNNHEIMLPNGQKVLLDQMYVSLRADEMNAKERKAEHTLSLEKIAALQQAARAMRRERYAESTSLRRAIARNPTSFMLDARNWPLLFGAREQQSLTLAEVVHRHAHVVILGDPGSGKTTLGKWLVLQFARALQQKEARVRVHADLVRPGAETTTLLDLGRTCLPVFLSIADYASARWPKGRDTELTLEEFLGSVEHLDRLPADLTREAVGVLIRDSLRQGQALIFLDGLDEVSKSSRRRKVMEAVRSFLQESSMKSEAKQGPASLERAAVGEPSGNRIVLTSRIVGYQFDPLIDLPHYTVEAMDDTAIAAFCHAWIRHVATPDYTVEAMDDIVFYHAWMHHLATPADPGASEGTSLVADYLPNFLAGQLKEAIFSHAHPGVRSMASNPLLLSIIAEVYWSNRSYDGSRTLPVRRVALFEAALLAFYNQREAFWDQAGITPVRLSRAFSTVAAAIHANETAGFATEGEVRKQLHTVPFDDEQIEAVLSAARDVAGFFIARGEGVYGFLHRAVQEYFAAQHLVSQPDQMIDNLVTLALNPTWREPVVLAVGIVSRSNHPEQSRLAELFAALLNAPDPAGDVLPRRELLGAAACMECEWVPQGVGQRLSASLLTYYERNRSKVLCQRIRQAFVAFQRCAIEARIEVEEVLSAAVQADVLEQRHAAVDLIIYTAWDSPTLAEALVRAWRTYADPAGSLLVALDNLHRRHPECFSDMFLPLRGGEATGLWQRAKRSQEWRALLQALYLSPSADCIPEQVNRDSPLTGFIMGMLNEISDQEALATLRRHFLSKVSKPGTAEARDAVLALSALGDTSWVQVYVQSVGEQKDLLRPIIAALALTLILDHDRASDLKSAYYQIEQRDRTLDRQVRNLAGEVTHIILSYLAKGGLISDALHGDYYAYNAYLATNLDRIPKIIREIEQDIEAVYLTWTNDGPTLLKRLDVKRPSLQRGQESNSLLGSIDRAWFALIKACVERWPEILSPPPEVQITDEELVRMIDDLTSPDETRREHACQVLEGKHPASTIGRDIIEHLAEMAKTHTDYPWIGNQLDRVLQAMLHDRPDWIRMWMMQASATEEITSAQTILRSIGRITPEAFDMLLHTLQEAASWVKKAVFRSFKRVVRLQQLLPKEYDGYLARLLAQLLVLWDQETDFTIRSAIIYVLIACWQERTTQDTRGQEKGRLKYWDPRFTLEQLQKTSHILGTRLLELLNDLPPGPDLAAAYTVLARLATYQSELIERAQVIFLQEISHPGAAAALVCLSVEKEWRSAAIEASPSSYDEAEKWRRHFKASHVYLYRESISTKLLSKLGNVLTDPKACLAALIDAGIDENDWDDMYHGVLVIAARTHLERSSDHDSNLLSFLVTRLQQAVEHEGWQARRSALAVVLACLEVMPTVLQNVAQGKLEPLLVKGANDKQSDDSRRFALTALSYLRVVTPEVITALLTACQDVKVVQQDAIVAASRFQSIKGELLPGLIPALTGSSVSTAHVVASLLGALGTSVAGEAPLLHEQIVNALVNALKEQRWKREGEIPSELEKALHTSLLQVTGWSE